VLEHRAAAKSQILLRDLSFAHAGAGSGGWNQGDVAKRSWHLAWLVFEHRDALRIITTEFGGA
jgi:hypothetical protein